MMVRMRNVYMAVVILTGCSSFLMGKRQAYKPNPPVDVTLGACMVDKAVIHWAPDLNSAPGTKFLIEYNTSYTPNVWINVVNVTDPQQTQVEVPLTPYRNFTFRVITENEYGKSAPSVHTWPPCLTPIGVPYTRPKDLTLMSANGYYYTFRWDPVDFSPEMMAGQFMGYKMKYWVSGKRMTTEKIQMLYGSLTDFGDFNEERAGLKLLPFDTEMAVEVVAFNDHFDSLPSNIVRFRTPKGAAPFATSYPIVEECDANNLKAVISWRDSPRTITPVTKYYVEYNTSFTPNTWTNVVNVTTQGVTRAEIPLSYYANYSFRVIAENEFGTSEPSVYSFPACMIPTMNVPEKNPSNVHTDTSKTHWLIIKWDVMPQIEHNGVGFGYIVGYRDKFGMNVMNRIEDWTQNEYSMPYYGVYQPVEIFVLARNALGDCTDPVKIHDGHSGEAVPKVQPHNFELVSLQENAACFQWDPVYLSPEVMQGEFKSYKIRTWKAGERDTTENIFFVNDEIIIPCSSDFDEALNGNTTETKTMKEAAKIVNLPFDADLEAEVVVSNTHFDSDPSNTIKFSTPKGGNGVSQGGMSKIIKALNVLLGRL